MAGGGELGGLRVREHPLRMQVHHSLPKIPLQNERKTWFETDLQQIQDSFDVHFRFLSG